MGLDRYVTDSLGKTRLIRGRKMKLTKNCCGYPVVNLRKYGLSNVVLVHRLVAEAFIENPDNLPTVNHKDGNKSNNTADNLEWASYQDNNIHALDNFLRKPRGTPIVQKNPNGQVIAIYKSTYEAARVTKINKVAISHCINKRSQTSGGFVWEKLLEGQTTI